MNEIELFDTFLYDLSNMVEDTENGIGRPKTPISDLIYCAVQKEYTQLSLRREHTLYKRAVEKNKISRVVGINAVSSFLNNEKNTPILRHLLRLSAAPLASIEKKFAVDSTGIRTTNYTEWCKEKHRTGKKNDWLKAHVCIGTSTNVITDMVVTGSNSADIKEFIPLVKGTMQYFDIEQVTADKGYLSRQNYDFGKIHGFDVFIPFKSNTTGRQGGSTIWGNAYWNFKNNNGYFMEQYNGRSNVESTFSSMKKKFGDSLKSRNYTAQVNELYCMGISENITLLIRAMYLHGIDVCFN
jgi:transposase